MGFNIIQVELFPFGGITRIDKYINTDSRKDILLALGGIIAQLFFIIILTFLFKIGLFPYKLYYLFLYYNIIVVIFNLLPIIPLDGYYLFKYILEVYFPYVKSFYFSVIISVVVLIIFSIMTSLYNLNNYIILSFLVFKLHDEFKNRKYIFNKFFLERYLHNFDFKKIKILRGTNIFKMFKNKYHLFMDNGGYKKEEDILNKTFDKKL